MSYDTKCHTLAGYFLRDFTVPDTEIAKVQDRLAQQIQDTIEEFVVDEGLKEKP